MAKDRSVVDFTGCTCSQMDQVILLNEAGCRLEATRRFDQVKNTGDYMMDRREKTRNEKIANR